MITPAREINEALVREWIAKLRSGEYKQGHKSLRVHNPHTNECTFCCLGVLQDIVGGGEWESLAGRDDTGSVRFNWHTPDGDYGVTAMPPPSVNVGLKHFGIRARHLSFLNDDHNESFTVIANHIECILNAHLAKAATDAASTTNQQDKEKV
jgi:hypothetical protein